MKTHSVQYENLKRIAMAALFAACFSLTTTTRAQNASGVWTGAGGDGLWTGDVNNWSSGVYASGSGNTADFSQVALSATSTVNVDAPITIGNLIFGNTAVTPTNDWYVTSNATTGNVLTLAGGSTINVGNIGTNVVYMNCSLAGTGGLIKTGPGALQLNAFANPFTGGVTFNQGTVILGTNSQGAGSDAGMSGGGTWTIGGNNGVCTLLVGLLGGNFTNPVSLAGPAVIANYQGKTTVEVGTGGITLNGNNLTISNGPNNTTGKYLVTDAITGSGSLTVYNNSASQQIQLQSINNTGAVNLIGTGAALNSFLAFTFGANPTAINYYGPAPVEGFTIPANTTGVETINSYSSVPFPSSTAITALTVASGLSNLTLNANSTGSIAIGTWASAFHGFLTNSGAGTGYSYVTAAITSADTTLSNVIQNSATSPLVLSGADTYTAPTLVQAGELLINGTGFASPVTVSSGGIVGGTGSGISSAITINVGGTLAPGTNTTAAVGTMTMTAAGKILLSGNAYFKLKKTGVSLSSDLVTGTTLLTNLGTGTLTLTNIGTGIISNGDTFQLFNQPLVGGSALAIVSSIGVFTNNLAVNGTITAGNPAPMISGISPPSGSSSGGTPVTITGNSFVNGATVTFGSTPAFSVTFNSSSSLSVVTPSGSGTVVVTVMNPDGQTATTSYTYVSTPPPAITSISPTNGPTSGGTFVTVTGSNFVSGDTVTFGAGSPIVATFNNSTSLSVTTPAHTAGTVNVTVTDSHGQSSTLAGGFTYQSPTPALWIAANGGGDGLWTGDTSNWTNGVVADLPDQTANFSTQDFTGGQTVHLDASVTNGSLVFGTTDTNTAVSWTVDNNASGTPGNTLTLAPAVGKSTITVSDPYALGNSATITAVLAGTNGFTLTGGGSLTLGVVGGTTLDTYTGGITIQNGALTLYGGAFDANNSDTVTLGSTNAGSSASLYLGPANFFNPIVLASNAQGTLTLGGDPVDSEHAAIMSPSVLLNGNTLNFVAPAGSVGNSFFQNGVTGPGNLNLVQNGNGTVLNNGTFNVGGIVNLEGVGSGKFSLGTISNATSVNYITDTALVNAGTVSPGVGGTVISSVSTLALTLGIGPSVGTGTLTLEANAASPIIINSVNFQFAGNMVNAGTGTGAGVISGGIFINSGMLNMVQDSPTSPLVLAGNNYYTVPTLVSNGTLLVNSALTPNQKGSPITVYSNGVLGGTGVIANVVTILPGGTLAPSTNDGLTIGTLTISNGPNLAGALVLEGNLLFKVNEGLAQSNDFVTGTSLLTNAGTGTLTIVNLGPSLNPGDTFQLFSQPLSNGNALTISGPVTFINNLAVNGSIQVAGANLPPSISSLTPNFGSTNGGTAVTINGANFLSGPTVTFGSLPALSVNYVSSTQIMATAPAQPSGTVTLTVTDTDSQTATAAYTYVLPPPPATAIASHSGSNLSLVWTGGTNENCLLRGTTNLTLPLSSWAVVATNSVGANGLSTNLIPINPGQPQFFYELSIPYN